MGVTSGGDAGGPRAPSSRARAAIAARPHLTHPRPPFPRRQADKADSLAGSSFEQLERDFQEARAVGTAVTANAASLTPFVAAQVLKELVGDKSLDRFRAEYEKLHRALKKSSEGEARLLAKCRELDGEIAANAARVQTALKLSQEDQQTILSLKREIDKAWRMAEASRDKEGRARETITALKGEVKPPASDARYPRSACLHAFACVDPLA